MNSAAKRVAPEPVGAEDVAPCGRDVAGAEVDVEPGGDKRISSNPAKLLILRERGATR